MARTVPADIDSALAAKVRCPNLSLVVDDPFDRPYSSATGGAVGRPAMVALPGGSYARAFVSQPGIGVDATVSTQIITDPTDVSELAAWSVRSTGGAQQAGVCLAVFGSTIYLFYQRRSDNAVCFQTSTDGLAWSAESVASTPGVRVWALASASNGDLFQAQDASPGDDSTQTIVLLTRAGSTFTTQAVWTNPFGAVTGLAAVFASGAYRLIVAGQSRIAGGQALCSLSYASGAWSTLTAIHPIDDPATGLSIEGASLTSVDGVYRVGALLQDSGTATGLPAQRTEMWTSPDFVHWRLEQVLSTPFSGGVAIVPGPSNGWLVADAGFVLLSTRAAGATASAIDLSDSVFSITIDEPASDVATATAVIDNHDGSNSPSSPPSGSLRVGGRVQLALGYGDDLVLTHTLWIDSINQTNDLVNGLETATVTLALSSRARRFDELPPVERLYAGASLLYLAGAVAVGAGIATAPTSPGTAQFAQPVAALSVSASVPYRESFDRLAQLFGFDWFLDENEALQLREPALTDPVDYVYSAATVPAIGHSIQPIRRANQIRVSAPAAGPTPAFADAVDTDHQAATGEVVMLRVTDRLLASSAQANIRAGLALRRAKRNGVQGSVRLPLNPAHQPLDVVTVADESAAVTVRLNRIRWFIDMTTNMFEQKVDVQLP